MVKKNNLCILCGTTKDLIELDGQREPFVICLKCLKESQDLYRGSE